MRGSEITSKVKVRSPLDIFQNFTYVSSYLHLKSFAWKRGCTISANVKLPQS